MNGFKRIEITETVYTFHREGIVQFDGKKIIYLRGPDINDSIEGQGSE